jgi:LysM repeat protein
MQSLRQIGLAIAVAVVSLGVVVGGLSLALSENITPPAAPTETLWLPTFAEFITPTATVEVLPSATSASPVIILPSPTLTLLPPPTSCAPPSGWVGVNVGFNDTLESMAARYRTTSQALAQGNCLLTSTLISGSVLFVPPIPTATVIPCGPPFGWIRYTVQQGDTLYHIATMFGITTAQLQQANCLGFSTNIRIGQLLWIPNRPPRFTNTPGVTLIATIYVPTETPTTPPPDTAVPPTATLQPTDTSVPVPTVTPITPQP